MPDTMMPEMGMSEQAQLEEARRANAQKSVEQAEEMLRQATTDDQRTIWQNRLAQRRAELDDLDQAEAA